MTELPDKIWARVKRVVRFVGVNREVGELREWCEGYATPEIAQTCGATEYTRTDVSDARIVELEAVLQDIASTGVGWTVRAARAALGKTTGEEDNA
jgi:hypothetical protein